MAISEGYIVYNKTIKTTYTYTTCLLYIKHRYMRVQTKWRTLGSKAFTWK